MPSSFRYSQESPTKPFFQCEPGREETPQLGIEHRDRLTLDHGVELFEELKAVGMNGVERPLGAVDELHGWRVVRLGEGIDFQTGPEQIAGEVRFAVDEESAQDQPVHVAGRLGGEVALGDRTLVIGREDQVLATLAPVGACGSGVDHEAEVGVVDRPRAGLGWDLDHRRAVLLEVEKDAAVYGVGVAGEEQGFAVHQLIEDQHLVRRPGAEGLLTAPESPAQKVEVVVEQLGGLLGGDPVEELEGADGSLDLVRGRDRIQNLLADLCADWQAHEECDDRCYGKVQADSEVCPTHFLLLGRSRFGLSRHVSFCHFSLANQIR
jgi:hypothetical protein